MKPALSVVATAVVLGLAPLAGAGFAATDDQPAQSRHFSAEDRAAFLDARIAALKAGLELTADQEKNWPALETAIRELAKKRAERFAAWKESRDEERGGDPISRLARMSERLDARAADLQKLAGAAKPLFDSLDDNQKRRFAALFSAVAGSGHWRHWRHEG